MKRLASTAREDKRFALKLWGGALALLAAATLAVWLVWGFRWPPTASVVNQGEDAPWFSPPEDMEYREDREYRP